MDGRVLYIEHAEARRRYLRARNRRQEIETSPEWRNSPRFNDELETAEIREAKRKKELEAVRDELKRSSDLVDRVYYYAFVEKRKRAYIARMTGYSERQIFRIIGQIKENMEQSLN